PHQCQARYVAFHYIAEDQYALMLDDIRVRKPGEANEQTVDLSRYVKSYPNPVADVWTVTAYGLDINRVEICNMQGGVVFRSAGNLATEAYRIDMSGFTPGLYMARVYTNAGVQVVKVTVQ
ncbi:MAG: T9SS type A sorting domain-containing protein, partial [Bacteroidales bacterium]|nr:T9SS type A sorting domain-containing protein [Bacteroidales bacterium]